MRPWVVTDEMRRRLLTEADVYAKYGLRRKQLRHLERIRALFPDHDDTVAAFDKYDAAVAASHASVAAWINRSPELGDALGAEGPGKVGRLLAGQRAERIEVVEQASLRFVEVVAEQGERSVWLLTLQGVREAFDPDAALSTSLSGLLDGFAFAVENADPGLGALDEIVGAFERITRLVVLHEADDLDPGEEPPHQSGNTVRFVASPSRRPRADPPRRQRPRPQHVSVVIDTSTPRLLR